ncbi:MAG: HAD family hydrolase [Fibrobacterota bacterium]
MTGIFKIEQYSNFFFDFDGTIIDNQRYHDRSLDQVFRKRGIQLSDFGSEKIKGLTTPDIVEFLNSKHGYNFDKNEIQTEKTEIYNSIFRPNPVRGIKEFTGKLKEKGAGVFMVTSAPKYYIDKYLRIINITLFTEENTISGDMVSKRKPDPEIYMLALRKFGIQKKASILVFEDSLLGVQSAVKAGLNCAGVLTSAKEKSLLEKGALFTINDFTIFR